MNERFRNYVNSAASGSASGLMIYPLQIIKSQYQVLLHGADSAHHRARTKFKVSIPKITSNIWNKNGLLGFYKGCSMQFMGTPVFWGTFFAIKDMKWHQLSENPDFNRFVASYVAASSAGCIVNPLYVLRTRMQTHILNNSQNKHTTFREIARNTFHNEGVKGFYKGLTASWISNGKIGLQFMLYDRLHEDFGINAPLASFIAKLSANSICYPIDIVRTNQKHHTTKLTFNQIQRQVYKNYGVRGFYRGLWLFNAISVPKFMLFMTLKDCFDKIW